MLQPGLPRTTSCHEPVVELALANAFQESHPEVGASGPLPETKGLAVPVLSLPCGWQYLNIARQLLLRKQSADHRVLLRNKRTAIKDARTALT